MNTEEQDKCYIDGLHGLLNILEQRAALDPRLSRARLVDLQACYEQLGELLARFTPGQAQAPMDKFGPWILQGLHKILRLLRDRLRYGPLLAPTQRHQLLDLINWLKKLLQI